MEGKQLQGNSAPMEQVSNSKACHKCGEEGHFVNKCPTLGQKKENDGKCRQCGEEGHKKRKCPQNEEAEKMTPAGDVKPFETPKEKKAPKEGKSLEEKWADVTCYKCGTQGHKQRKCPENVAPKGETAVCKRCNGTGCQLVNKDERKEQRLALRDARKAEKQEQREQKKAEKQALKGNTPADDLVSMTAESTAQPQVEVQAAKAGPTGPQWKF